VKRGLTIAGVVLLVAVVVGALTFPTDALVRSVVRQIPFPAGTQFQFAGAHLRPNGLRLEDVHILRPDGPAVFDALSLRLQPSLWGVWRDGSGRPWTIAAETCQGTIELNVGETPPGTPIVVTLRNVELATCLAYALPEVDAYGRLEGDFDVELGPAGAATASKGTLALTSASWTPGGPLEDDALRIDTGNLAWRWANNRIEITRIAAFGKDFQATGSGIIRIMSPVDDSPVDIRLEVTPGETMPPTLRQYFDGIPGGAPTEQGTRTFNLQGQLRSPRLVGPPGRG
jgi:type II secretion system protein N